MNSSEPTVPTHAIGLSPEVEFRSLQYALFTTCFVEILGGLFFLLTSVYVVQDKEAAEQQLEGNLSFLVKMFFFFLMMKKYTCNHSSTQGVQILTVSVER